MTTTKQMNPVPRWLRWLAVLLSLTIFAAACGDDGDESTDASEETADTSEEATDDGEEATDDAGEEATDDGGSEEATGLLAELQEEGVVTVGLANEIPYGYEDENGEIKGEAPDVARAVLAELGINEIEAEVVDFGALIPGLQAGQYDMIAAGMFITPERAEQIIFSDPDYCSTYAFAVAEGNPLGVEGNFSSIVDTGARLAVLSGAVDEDYAADAEVPSDQIELFADVNAQYEALLAGRVDAVGGTSLTVNNQVSANESEMDATPAFVPLDENGEEVLGCGGFGFVDQEFRDAFNEKLRELIADGTVEGLVTAYGFAPEEVQTASELTVEDLVGG